LAWGCAVGAAAGALALAAGADVGSGTAVAEDPQANSRATNSRMMALGRYLLIVIPVVILAYSIPP